jgi:hypothetical protein
MDQMLALEAGNSEAIDLRGRAREALEKQRKEERDRKELADALASAQQCLFRGELNAARGHVSRARALDRENADAARFHAQIEKNEAELREKQQRKQRCQELVTEAQTALKTGDADRAGVLLAEAVTLGLASPATIAMQKRIDKQQRRLRKNLPAVASVPDVPSSQRARVPRPVIWLGITIGAIGVGLLIWTLVPKGPQYQEQIASARSYLDRNEFDKVAGALQSIPPNSPLYAQAQVLIQQARNGEKQKTIDASLAEASNLLQQGRNAESLAAAQRVLQLDSSNEAAKSLRYETERQGYEDKTQAQREQFVTSTLASAEALLKSGNLEGAMGKTDEVLRVVPGETTAAGLKRRILNQIDGSKRTDTERAKLAQVKGDAENANASELASTRFAAAQRAEETGLREQNAGQFDRAAKTFSDAAALYAAADKEARAETQARADREKENQQKAATLQVLRSQAETARSEYEKSRANAQTADAENKARDRFQATVRLAATAQGRFDSGDFAAARTGWDNASNQMQQVQAEAVRATQAVQTAAAVPSTTSPRASTPPADDRNRQAAEAAQREEAERQAIRTLLERYRTAYETRNMAAIRTVFPDISGTEEKGHIGNFDLARSIQMQLVGKEIQISGETARAVYQQQIEIRTKADNRRFSAPEVAVTFNLQKRGGSWVIVSITR